MKQIIHSIKLEQQKHSWIWEKYRDRGKYELINPALKHLNT